MRGLVSRCPWGGVACWLQVFGNSPDETAYCRLVLNRETVPDALVMIQPTLLAYSLDAPPTPVSAGSGSLESSFRVLH